jgi:heterodisulfide reductase subunit A
MVSALCLAKQRFQVFLVECEGELGGNLRHIHYTFDGGDPQDYLRSLIRKVEAQDGITIYKNARLQGFSGYVGNYKTKLSIQDKDELEIRHGVLILATGGVEYKPTGEYMYGEDGRVVTQRELEEEIASRRPRIGRLRSVVMIQCVGSRNEDRPYCSRYCCGEAVKNAVRLKDICPELEIYILYKDVRTYGFLEGHYNEARKRGVVFIRYDDSCVPEVSRREEGLEVKVFDPILQEAILIRCDLLVLSTALLPHPSNKVLAALFKVPLTTDGFFQEAHPKLRPVDFSSDGIFLAGVCHSPKMLDGAISQALAAASRAGTILSKDEIEAEGVVAVVDPDGCAACLTCIRSCPYDVPFINEQGIAEIEPVKCHGCGTCAGVCPGKAIELQNYKDKQILAKCEALFD